MKQAIIDFLFALNFQKIRETHYVFRGKNADRVVVSFWEQWEQDLGTQLKIHSCLQNEEKELQFFLYKDGTITGGCGDTTLEKLCNQISELVDANSH